MPNLYLKRTRVIAIIKLAACTVVSLVLFLLWHFGADSPFRGVALGILAIVGLPTTLLVAIDTGRILRENSQLGVAADVTLWLPQAFLGSLACFTGAAGLAMALSGLLPDWWSRAYCIVISFLIFYYGQSQLRGLRKSR
jgi:hypothetical protein